MNNLSDLARLHSINGSILGTAVGDALGLPYEGLSRRRAARLFGPPTRHRLLFGRGMVSDDTEHTCLVYHTAPVAIHAWLSNQSDYRAAVTAVIDCGGDTDSTAAIVGGILGASVGKAGIPQDWLASLCEWPRSVSWMERLADQLDESLRTQAPARPIRVPIWAVGLRNLVFLAVVLFHGFRRLLPPY